MAMISVAALYHFARIDTPASLRQPLLDLCLEEGIRGTLLLAEEGVNGTIAGPADGIEKVIAHLRGWPGFADLEEYSLPHLRRVPADEGAAKSEIVTMGKPGIDPAHDTGTYVDPKDWNALISRNDVMVIDTRNDYEIRIGRFRHCRS